MTSLLYYRRAELFGASYSSMLGQFACYVDETELFLRGLHSPKSLAKIGFQLVVRYLFAKSLKEFGKPSLRKFFHGLAEGPHLITDNQGCYALHDVGELTEVSDHTVKSVLRHRFASGFRYERRDSRRQKVESGRFLFAWFQLLACDNCAHSLRLNTNQSCFLTVLHPIRLGC